MNKCKFKERGITLVALVVTIIVLLILAGISIQAITNTGLFANAKLAKEKTIKAEMQEAVSIAVQNLQIDKLGGATLNDINEDWLNKQKLSERYNAIILNDNNGKKIRLKKGEISLTCLIDINMNITICKAVGISYTVDKTTFKDNTVKIRITVINDEKGLKTIEMPDGNIIDCNGEHEKEIEYTITLGQEYIIKIISEDESVDNEKIKIDSIPCNVTVELSIGAEMNNKSIVTDYGKTYENTITATGDYVITGITATMDGGTLKVDNTTGRISTEKVTGDIQIIVTTQKMEISITEEVVNTSTSFGGKSEEKNSITAGSSAYIKLKASTNVNGASLTIEPKVPYRIIKNGNYKFVITAQYNGKKVEIQKNVEVNQFEVASNLVKYDAGKWTKEEIDYLKAKSLYNINITKIASREKGLNFTFGGFTYEGDIDNEDCINKGIITTSRNKSVDPKDDYGNNYYDGWQILSSEEKDNKTYVSKIIHTGSTENFVYYNCKDGDSNEAEYILSGGKRKINYNTYEARDWNMYKDKNQIDIIEEVHAITYDEIRTKTTVQRTTGADYWCASAIGSKNLWMVGYKGDMISQNNKYCFRYTSSSYI